MGSSTELSLSVEYLARGCQFDWRGLLGLGDLFIPEILTSFLNIHTLSTELNAVGRT